MLAGVGKGGGGLGGVDDGVDDDDELLQDALLLSMMNAGNYWRGVGDDDNGDDDDWLETFDEVLMNGERDGVEASRDNLVEEYGEEEVHYHHYEDGDFHPDHLVRFDEETSLKKPFNNKR